jgi:hypothetical protein
VFLHDDGDVKTVSYRALKKQEASRRMASATRVRRSPQAVRLVQRRASLASPGARWKIVNLRQVAQAMAGRA